MFSPVSSLGNAFISFLTISECSELATSDEILEKFSLTTAGTEFHHRLDFQNCCWILALREINGNLKCSEKQNIRI